MVNTIQIKETSPQKVRKCFQIEMRTLDVMNQLFHILPGFFHARRYHARAQNQVVNKDEGILQSGANMSDDVKRLVAASRFASISYFGF